MVMASILMLQANASVQFKGNERERLNFNSQWLLHVGDYNGVGKAFYDPGYNDRRWKKVTLPHAFNENEAFSVDIRLHTDTVSWYRKHFRLPSDARGKKVFLEFEGIRFGGEFWVNGRSVGIHENGVMAFGLDITDFVNYNGNNVIAARIDNSWQYTERATGTRYQWNDKNFNANYGGIPKNVILHIAPGVYQTLPLYSNLATTGTYIYAREINISRRNAMVFAESEVKNETSQQQEFSYNVVIEDMDGKVVSEMDGPTVKIAPGETTTVRTGARVNDLNFWSWGYGYLYNVHTILKMNGVPKDVVTTRTGFRKTGFRDGMVYLNDRVIQFKGYAQRTSNEWPSVGMSVPPWLSDYSNRLMVESNANLVRWMHVTPWKQDVESCDRVGLIQAMPAGDAEKDVEGRQWEQRLELMRDAIIYLRNSPSIIFYESGNSNISEQHMIEMREIRDKYDPHGGRAIGSRGMLGSSETEWGGDMLYINKSAKFPMWATEYLRDEALRRYWDNYSYPFHQDGDGPSFYWSTVTNEMVQRPDARVYNRNQDSFFKETIVRWFDYFMVRPGTGKRVSSGGTNIIFSDTNTHYRGTETYRRSGEVDAMRIAKDAFYAHQVMWNGWVDIEEHGSYICGHWEQPFNPPVGGNEPVMRADKDIMVVSTGEKVELFVNGKSRGFGTREYHFLFTFPKVAFEAGVVEAVSYDAMGKEINRTRKETAGKPQSIKLTMLQAADGFKADGADLVLVEIEVVDEHGRRCPLANNLISFDLQGEAEWRGGIGHGRDDNYILQKVLPVESGVNRVLIRSTNKAGRVRLTARSQGLESAELVFRSVAVQERNGLSGYFSGNHQPSNLDRGPTPTTPSFTMSRTPLRIVGATAGSNEKDATLSYDDNERTLWANDGMMHTAWIKYELERDATISEVDLKMGDFRNRSYPIRIYVDDELVFQGNTARSLGYIHIPVKPTKGRYVTILLTGQNIEGDAFADIIEITGLKEIESHNRNVRGQLRILEVEFFEDVNL